MNLEHTVNTYCKNLTFPVKVFNESLNTIEYSQNRFTPFDLSNFTPEYLDWVKNLGLTLVHAELFYSVPNTPYVIHQDHFKKTDFPKINFVYGGKNSKMNWYNVKPEKLGKIIESNKNITDKKYTEIYTKDQVDLVYSQELEGVNLVQAGIPHNVTNDIEPRWCVTTLYLLDNKRFLTWTEAVTLFKPFMISD